MNTKIYSLLATAALVAGLTACNDDPAYIIDGNAATDTAEVSLADLLPEVDPTEIELSRAADIDTDAFLLTITDAAGNAVYTSTVAERNEIVTLPVAQGYTAEVKSHELNNVAWNEPYYYGTTTFNVQKNVVNSVGSVVCTFANIRVSILYDEALLPLLGDDVRVSVTCSDNGSEAIFLPTETRSAYFAAAPGSTTLAAVMTGTVKGQPVTLQKTLTDVAAGQHRRITFRLRQGDIVPPDEYGSISLGEGLSIDINVDDEEVQGNVDIDPDPVLPGERPGEEEQQQPDPQPDPQPTSGPTITSADMSFTEPMNPAAGWSGIVNLHADAGIANLIVVIDTSNADLSDLVSQMNFLPSFDLANIDTTDAILTGSLQGLGFPFNDAVKGKNDVEFNISQFVPLLVTFTGSHRFHLTVTDAQGATVEKTLEFVVG